MCINCGDVNTADVRHVCRVCELVDADTSIKRVKWCKDCHAYICDNCNGDVVRRAKALAYDKIEKVNDGIKKTIKKAKNYLTDEF